LVLKIGEFEKSGVKLQCSTEEGKRPLVRVIGKFEKLRVREIGIPLYYTIFIHPNQRELTKVDSIRRSSEDEKLKNVNKVAEVLSGK